MNDKLTITGLLATTTDGVIGLNGKLPWNYPEELAHFRDITKNQILILGRKTYDSIPKKFLNDRFSIVLSKSSYNNTENAIFLNSTQECLEYLKTLKSNRKIFMIGGSEITDQFISQNLLSKFILSIIYKYYEGDSFINLGYFKNWEREKVTLYNDFSIYYLNNPSFN